MAIASGAPLYAPQATALASEMEPMASIPSGEHLVLPWQGEDGAGEHMLSCVVTAPDCLTALTNWSMQTSGRSELLVDPAY